MQGRDKFKQYKEFCCGLVLHNVGQPLVSLHEPDIMLGAMYGDSGFTFPVDTSTGVGDSSKLKRAFLGRAKMISPNWGFTERGRQKEAATMGEMSSRIWWMPVATATGLS